MGSEWEITTLGEFAPFTYGKSLPARDRKESGEILVYGSGGKNGKHDKPLVKEAGIIVGRKGTVGSVLFSEKPFWPIDTTFYITRKEGQDLKFTYYLLKTLRLNEMNADSAVPGLNRDEAHSISFKLPSYGEQKVIAGVLESLDNKIQLNRETNKTLEAMAQALFKSWFVDFDPVIDNALAAGNKIPEPLQARAAARKARAAENSSGSTAAHNNPTFLAGLPKAQRELFPSEFEETEALGWVPKGWGVNSVESLVSRLKSGKRYSKKDVLPYGQTPVFEQGQNVLLGYHNDEANFFASIEDPVFIFGDHTCVTKLGVVPFSISANVIPLKGLIRNTYWTYFAVKDLQEFEEYRRHWMEFAIRPVVTPTVVVADLFADIIFPLQQKSNDFEISSNTLGRLRDTLLPKLISGELRLPDAEKQAEALAK